jgi:opine dehydrogenase
MNISISVIGAGHCGCALAADLAGRGAQVLLYADPAHRRNFDAIHENGVLNASGMISGTSQPILAWDLASAVRFSRYLIVTVPAFGHDALIAELSRFDLSDHVLICITGNFFSLTARQILRAKAFIETSSAPYACRASGADVHIMGVKSVMPVAMLSDQVGSEIRVQVQQLFPMPLEWYENVLELGFSCISGVIHPTPAVMNAGWIESTEGDFHFYKQGMSAAVARVMSRLDQERLHIAEAYGFALPSTVTVMNRYYDGDFTDIADFARRSTTHNAAKMAPATLDHRYIAQDVPYILVPWYALGRKAGLEARTIRSVIHMASLLHDTNFMESGRTLRKLGLAHFTQDEILESVGVSERIVELSI